MPFLLAITRTTQSMLTAIEVNLQFFGMTDSVISESQTVRRNKSDCTQLLEQIHKLLYAIIDLHIKSDTLELAPSTLYNIGKFAETLHKIHTFVEAQQDRSRIRQFFRQGEMSILLRDCNAGLQQVLEAFQVGGIILPTHIAEMRQYAQTRHEEVLELIDSLSDATGSDTIFHGHEPELSDILKAFASETPRIAILGAGGMGKTSLATAVLHHSQITARYGQHRFFVACDSASTKLELMALVGAHLSLKPGKDLTQHVIHYFSSNSPCLLILDNLETVWEPTEPCDDIEELLSLLTDIQDLALIITLHGAERPGKVRWTRLFLPPLKPLPLEAARNMFIDIADDSQRTEEVDKVLSLTGNMPLAISLLAHLADSEGCLNVANSYYKFALNISELWGVLGWLAKVP
ncbi:hypothetical protein B0H10DRAFT_1971304 [Mycena sp. CBHHK59/15]|nr:hypothetical protein B0H10DRAFT_1971304 [Mycena sp. CBHHK59/15]